MNSLQNLNSNEPFSPRLNAFILQWFNLNSDKFREYPENRFNFDNPAQTFSNFHYHFTEYGTVPMWYDENEDNIFASTEVNAKFRAWHDYMHVVNNFDFSLCGEVKTFLEQVKMLPEDWKLEIKLLEAEIVGQAMHYTTYGNTPIPSQRYFTLNYITDSYETGF